MPELGKRSVLATRGPLSGARLVRPENLERPFSSPTSLVNRIAWQRHTQRALRQRPQLEREPQVARPPGRRLTLPDRSQPNHVEQVVFYFHIVVALGVLPLLFVTRVVFRAIEQVRGQPIGQRLVGARPPEVLPDRDASTTARHVEPRPTPRAKEHFVRRQVGQ